jgi:hypothetical protein
VILYPPPAFFTHPHSRGRGLGKGVPAAGGGLPTLGKGEARANAVIERLFENAGYDPEFSNNL